MSFESIIGHEFIKKQIESSIQQGNFSHAHLIIGEDGIGKSLIAKEIALKLLGKHKNRNYVDIIEWSTQKNKQSIGVNEVRDIIKEVNKKPYEGDKKVIIIYESHKMTVEAQNALLKTIEEPPKGVTLILLSESLELILETIRSRCQIHKLKRLNLRQIEEYIIREYPELDEEKTKAVIAFSDGIPGRCKLFLEDSSFNEIRDISIQILLELSKKEKNIVKKYESFFYKYGKQWDEVLTCFIAYIRDIMIYKETGRQEFVINNDKFDNIKELSNMYSFNKLNGIFKEINDMREKLERRVNSALAFDIMLLKMQEV
ncbi:DNA polymerase III subunit delta' [Clostridium ganghwense]|uniref:DNA polymerase III subunit delta' n=1 Tax=Clostridium ganghwense TaxID=312089 RepID=A0ABT4CMI9_9CLOT|nr:DNA polymerase III subunit delta' [Clostridium ganghwense]MCY6370266.1 DNA polymerase III subunit delta' [Clostridium ganghwense]